MTPQQIDLAADSFAAVPRRRQDAGTIVYRHLFAIAPGPRLLFGSDLDVQARKLSKPHSAMRPTRVRARLVSP